MNNLTASKEGYDKILNSIISHIEQSKLRAFSEVNKALLQAYWNIGKELSKNAAYGSSVVEKLSRDLRLKYPGMRGYSITNLWNMKRFYETYQKLQSVTGEFKNRKLQPPVAESKKFHPVVGGSQVGESQKLQPLAGESTHRKLQSLPADLLFQVSWTNHVIIMDKTSSPEEKEFYIKMCIKERWSKRELERQLDSSLFERYMLVDKPEKVTALIPRHKSEDYSKGISRMSTY